ncbi:UDP-N-acetyl-D-glucosamine dehydrogenase, partial [Candidatus Bipolaricaulota bacterium]|nr:UDP-N-acetyl-D-glucosamine dehydrogenase [Candidatus Bipolaricaulota bacterium]
MAATDKTLRARFESQEATIAIIGLGYVGLPLAVEFARQGFSVIGIERNAKRVTMVNRGENYISDVLIEDLSKVVACGQLRATQTFEGIKEADAILICVPTPLDKNKQPYTYFIEHVVEESLPFLRKQQLIVLESTTYPGTTEEI